MIPYTYFDKSFDYKLFYLPKLEGKKDVRTIVVSINKQIYNSDRMQHKKTKINPIISTICCIVRSCHESRAMGLVVTFFETSEQRYCNVTSRIQTLFVAGYLRILCHVIYHMQMTRVYMVLTVTWSYKWSYKCHYIVYNVTYIIIVFYAHIMWLCGVGDFVSHTFWLYNYLIKFCINLKHLKYFVYYQIAQLR